MGVSNIIDLYTCEVDEQKCLEDDVADVVISNLVHFIYDEYLQKNTGALQVDFVDVTTSETSLP